MTPVHPCAHYSLRSQMTHSVPPLLPEHLLSVPHQIFVPLPISSLLHLKVPLLDHRSVEIESYTHTHTHAEHISVAR